MPHRTTAVVVIMTGKAFVIVIARWTKIFGQALGAKGRTQRLPDGRMTKRPIREGR